MTEIRGGTHDCGLVASHVRPDRRSPTSHDVGSPHHVTWQSGGGVDAFVRLCNALSLDEELLGPLYWICLCSTWPRAMHSACPRCATFDSGSVHEADDSSDGQAMLPTLQRRQPFQRSVAVVLLASRPMLAPP